MNTLHESWQEKAKQLFPIDPNECLCPNLGDVDYLQGATDYMAAVEQDNKNDLAELNKRYNEHFDKNEMQECTRLRAIIDYLTGKDLSILKPL